MLASILPGLRDFRTPFLVGCLWFLGLWLWFGGDVLLPKNHPGNEAMNRLVSLSDLLGPHVTIAAIGVAAYLVGSLLTLEAPPPRPRRVLEETIPREGRRPKNKWKVIVTKTSNPAPPSVRFWLERMLDERKVRPILGEINGEPVENHFNAIEAHLQQEFTELIVRMKTHHQSLFNDFDRETSEASLRMSIALPLAMISIVLAFVGSPWWLFGLLGAIIFFYIGIRDYDRAALNVWTALTSNLIESDTVRPTIDELAAINVRELEEQELLDRERRRLGLS